MALEEEVVTSLSGLQHWGEGEWPTRISTKAQVGLVWFPSVCCFSEPVLDKRGMEITPATWKPITCTVSITLVSFGVLCSTEGYFTLSYRTVSINRAGPRETQDHPSYIPHTQAVWDITMVAMSMTIHMDKQSLSVTCHSKTTTMSTFQSKTVKQYEEKKNLERSHEFSKTWSTL